MAWQQCRYIPRVSCATLARDSLGEVIEEFLDVGVPLLRHPRHDDLHRSVLCETGLLPKLLRFGEQTSTMGVTGYGMLSVGGDYPTSHLIPGVTLFSVGGRQL